MFRIVYVPSESPIQEGENLAYEHQLPIIHGEAEYLQNIDFDRTKIQVLHIPENNYTSQSAKSIQCGLNINILHVDEFSNLQEKDCNIEYWYEEKENNKIKIDPTYKEKHVVSFNIRPYEKGTITYNLIINNNIIYEDMFGVL